MITHRCKESLKNKTPIRYTKPYYEEEGWWLFRYWENYDWDSKGITSVCKIKYCPFCGKKLDSKGEY